MGYVGPSVRWSARLLVRPLVRPSEITLLFQAYRAERRSDLSYCPCPVTILPLPTRTRLMLPCIQPCWDLVHSLLISFCFGSEILKKNGPPPPPKKKKKKKKKS